MHSPLPRSSLKPRLMGPSLTRLKSVLKPKFAAAAKPAPGPSAPLKTAAPQGSASAPAPAAPSKESAPQQAERPEDRRRTSRRTINRTAKIQFGAGTPPRNCTITDISAGGVRLKVEGFEVPDAFVLFVNVSGVQRECIYRVVWRLGPEIGAAFVRFVKRK
jgi:PilZ domain